MKLDVPDLVQASSSAEISKIKTAAIFALGKRLERALSLLEAGCGQCWRIDLKGLQYTLTGVDQDAVALDLRKNVVRDLDVAICGDLCSLELSEASFDVVYCDFVLEHVTQADLALCNFVKWLRPGGIIILGLPDPGTVRGFFARVLPHWTHVWYYRRICGSKSAG